MAGKTETVEAVSRALALLKAFRDGREALSLTELARETGLYKSTALRLAASLEVDGFLQRGPDRAFRPGPELWRLGVLYRRRLDIGAFIRPKLAELVAATGETASYYIREGEERICLYRQNSPRPVRYHLDEGARLPLRQGAAGRVLSAYSQPHTPDGDKIREAGYCVSLGERDPEVGAVAVPVFDAVNELRGALSVSSILTRFDEAARQKALAALRQAACDLSQTLVALT